MPGYFIIALTSLVAGFICFTSPVVAHSWPEALNLIDNQGTIDGPTGYVRNFVPRSAPGFKGDQTDSFQKTQVVAGAKVCMNREIAQTQSTGYPRLAVTPGAKVALRYAENGHVTIEEAGRPANGGPVYIFGTTDGTMNPLITDVMMWNAGGTGGNKQGKLLTTLNFDDGRCYENNNSPKAQQRKAAYPIGNQLALPDFSGLPCQNDFNVPADVAIGKPYTVFWVWNFTFTTPPERGVEIFSNCLDLDVHSPSGNGVSKAAAAPQAFNQSQPAISAAVQSYFDELIVKPSSAANPPPATASATAPGSSVTSIQVSIGGLLSEASDGNIYASQATGSVATQYPTVTVTAAAKTVYVTLGASSVAAPSAIAPTAAVSSATQVSVPKSLSSTIQNTQTTLQRHTCNSTAQTTGATTPAASTSTINILPPTSPVNSLNIPLLSIGPTGVRRIVSTTGLIPTSSPDPKNTQKYLSASVEPSATSISTKVSDNPCKSKRWIKRSKIFNP